LETVQEIIEMCREDWAQAGHISIPENDMILRSFNYFYQNLLLREAVLLENTLVRPCLLKDNLKIFQQ
jgi:hypothetical protein